MLKSGTKCMRVFRTLSYTFSKPFKKKNLSTKCTVFAQGAGEASK